MEFTMKITRTHSTLSLALALQAGAMVGAALVLTPSDAEAGARFKPGPKPGKGGKRPEPRFQPCFPDPRQCSGGGF